MGKSSPSPPAAPDPVATANAQGAANKDTAVAQAQLNAMNQITPYGNLRYTSTPSSSDPTVPQYTATETLSPPEQQLLQTTQGLQQGGANAAGDYLSQIQNNANNPFPSGQLNPLTTDFTADNQATVAALQARQQPQMQHDQAALNNTLANQGITPGSDAWKYAQTQLSQNQNDLLTQQQLAGNQEQQALFGMNMATNQAQFGEQAQEQQMPINELDALLSSSQVQNPSYVSTPQTQVGQTPLSQDVYASYQGNVNNYNQQVAQQNQTMSGLFGLGGSAAAGYLSNPALFASDRRLKENLKKIGKTSKGFNWYEFNYIGSHAKHAGVMAQEVEKIIPDAVINNGVFKSVNYAMVV